MTPKMLWEMVKFLFLPHFLNRTTEGEVVRWFPIGKKSIRIKTKNHKEFVFTYEDEDNWILETYKVYLLRMRPIFTHPIKERKR